MGLTAGQTPRRGGSEKRANKEMGLVTNGYLTSSEYSRSSSAYFCDHLAPGHIHGVREGSRLRRAIRGRRIQGAASAAAPASSALAASRLRAAGRDGRVRTAPRDRAADSELH